MTSTGTDAPSSSALANAPRTRDSAAASGMRRRSAWCHRSRVHASRAASTCSGMPGSSASRVTAATAWLSGDTPTSLGGRASARRRAGGSGRRGGPWSPRAGSPRRAGRRRRCRSTARRGASPAPDRRAPGRSARASAPSPGTPRSNDTGMSASTAYGSIADVRLTAVAHPQPGTDDAAPRRAPDGEPRGGRVDPHVEPVEHGDRRRRGRCLTRCRQALIRRRAPPVARARGAPGPAAATSPNVPTSRTRSTGPASPSCTTRTWAVDDAAARPAAPRRAPRPARRPPRTGSARSTTAGRCARMP